MEHKCVRLLLTVTLLCVVRSGLAQTNEVEVVHGEVHMDSPAIHSHNQITLTDPRTHNTIASADVRGDGTFQMRRVPLGDYILTVLEDNTREIYSDLVTVRQQDRPLLVQVPAERTERPPAGPVSIGQLLHPPAKKALNALATAEKLSGSGDHEKAALELEKALRISPAYADAWINLAAQHIRLGRFEEALQELQHATEITKLTPMILNDMAFAQFGLHREQDAIQSARQALQLDGANTSSHYLLGVFLSNDRRTIPESMRHLEIAARSMPSAQELLARMRRDQAQAVTHP